MLLHRALIFSFYFCFDDVEKLHGYTGEIIHIDIAEGSMSQDILGTDIYIGNVFGEDVASVGCEKSDVYNPHMTAPRRAVYFCDSLFSRVLKNRRWLSTRMSITVVIRLITRLRRVRKDAGASRSVSFYLDILLRGPLMEQNGRSVARPAAFFVAHSNFRSWDFIYYAPGRVVAAARHDIIIATVPRLSFLASSPSPL